MHGTYGTYPGNTQAWPDQDVFGFAVYVPIFPSGALFALSLVLFY